MIEYSKDFIKELSILLAKDFDRTDYLNVLGKSFTGILPNDKVGILPGGGFTDSVIAGCNPTFKSQPSLDKETWSLNNFMIATQWCYDQLDSELKRNQALYDLTENEAANAWITDYMQRALSESVIARAMFASTTAADYTTAGLNGIDGILTQMLNYVSGGQADASQVVPITTNTKAWGKTGTNTIDTLEALIDAASADVKASPNAVIVMTQAFYDCLRYNLVINKGIYIESQWTALFGGLKETEYNGYKIIIVPAMDNVITHMVSGDKFYQKPLVAYMTTTDNVYFGSQSNKEAGIADLDIFNDKNTQTTKAIAKFSLGVVLPSAKDFSLAY